MKKFVGRFAKWRYETLHYVLESLKAMLSWVWQFLIQKVDSIFPDFQDGSLLHAVKEGIAGMSYGILWSFSLPTLRVFWKGLGGGV